MANHTPSPVIDPSVHTILVGHSMGGIVAADALLSIMDDEPVTGDSKLPFPHIVGILAFDTPYLGLAPSVFAHSAEEKWKTASGAYGTLSSIASGLFASQAAVEGTMVTTREREEAEDEHGRKNELSQQSLWGRWGKVAVYGGAAAALAGGAAAAYIKRDDISAGFGWVSSHLEFVGALMKAEELRVRLDRAAGIEGVGFANLFTSLGGDRMGTSVMFDGKERTFCSLPTDESPLRKKFFRCVNVSAADEVGAHCSMFEAKTNPAYFELAERARDLICVWVREDMFFETDEDDFGSYDYHSESHGRQGNPPMPGMARAHTFQYDREPPMPTVARANTFQYDGEPPIARTNTFLYDTEPSKPSKSSWRWGHGEGKSSRSSSRPGELKSTDSGSRYGLERTDSGISSKSDRDKREETKEERRERKEREKRERKEREETREERKERKEREKKGRSESIDKRPRHGRSESSYDREQLQRTSSGYSRDLERTGSGMSSRSEREKDNSSKRKSSTMNHHYQMDHDDNPWR